VRNPDFGVEPNFFIKSFPHSIPATIQSCNTDLAAAPKETPVHIALPKKPPAK